MTNTNVTKERIDIWRYNVGRCEDSGEWIVRVWRNGIRYTDADYFSPDKDDAIATMEAMKRTDAERAQAKREAIEEVYAMGKERGEAFGRGVDFCDFLREETQAPEPGCDSCEMLNINGLNCHESGCPNA